MAVTVYISPNVAVVRALYGPLLDAAARQKPIRVQLADQAVRLLEGHAAGDPGLQMPVASWHPGRIGQRLDTLLSQPLDEADARLTVAREHGYADWAAVEALGDATSDAGFEAAVDALLSGDIGRLREFLAATPALVNQRSAFAHRAGLLHYLAANGVESWRQVTPSNADALAALLIETGADVNGETPIYGGARPLGLLVTSAHPHAAGVVDAVADRLRAAHAY